MTTPDIDRIRELEAAASPAPWEWDDEQGGYMRSGSNSVFHAYPILDDDNPLVGEIVDYALFITADDVEFIAAARNILPTLLAAVDERDKRITELEARIADLEHESDAGWAQAKSDNARIEAVRHELEMRYGDGTVEAQFIREALDGDL